MRIQIDDLGKVAVTVEQGYWDINKDYPELAIVQVKYEFKTYISRKPVPANTSLNDRKYWIPFSSLKEELLIDYNKHIADLTAELKKWIDDIESNKNALNNLNYIYDIGFVYKPNSIDLIYNKKNALTGSNSIETIALNKANSENAGLLSNSMFQELNTPNVANHYVRLPSNGLIPSNLLPSYIDDVIEYENLNSFPNTGETGKIYVALDTNKIYRWSGSTYINIANIDLATTTSDGLLSKEDKIIINNLPGKILSSPAIIGEYNNPNKVLLQFSVVTLSDKPDYGMDSVLLPLASKHSAGLMTIEDKQKLDELNNNIVLPDNILTKDNVFASIDSNSIPLPVSFNSTSNKLATCFYIDDADVDNVSKNPFNLEYKGAGYYLNFNVTKTLNNNYSKVKAFVLSDYLHKQLNDYNNIIEETTPNITNSFNIQEENIPVEYDGKIFNVVLITDNTDGNKISNVAFPIRELLHTDNKELTDYNFCPIWLDKDTITGYTQLNICTTKVPEEIEDHISINFDKKLNDIFGYSSCYNLVDGNYLYWALTDYTRLLTNNITGNNKTIRKLILNQRFDYNTHSYQSTEFGIEAERYNIHKSPNAYIDNVIRKSNNNTDINIYTTDDGYNTYEYGENNNNLVTVNYALSKFAQKENSILESASNLLNVLDDNDLIYVPKGISDIDRNIVNGRIEPITVKQAYDAGRTPTAGPVVVTFNKPTFKLAESAILEADSLLASDGNKLRLYVERLTESGDSLQLKVSAINNTDSTGGSYVPNIPVDTTFNIKNGGLYLNIKAGKGLEKYKENGYPYFKIDDSVLTDENFKNKYNIKEFNINASYETFIPLYYKQELLGIKSRYNYNNTDKSGNSPITIGLTDNLLELKIYDTDKTKTYTTNSKNIVTADYLHTKFLEKSIIKENFGPRVNDVIPLINRENYIGIGVGGNSEILNNFDKPAFRLKNNGNILSADIYITDISGNTEYSDNSRNFVTAGYLNKRLKKLDNSPFLVVTELPSTNINPNKIYLVSSDATQVALEGETEIPKQNIYIEWLYVNDAWEKLGEVAVDVDLTNYYTKTESDNRYFKISDLKTDLSINRDNYVPLVNIKEWNANNPQAGIAFVSEELVTTINNNPVRLNKNGNVLKVVSYITNNNAIDYSQSANLTTSKYVHGKFLTKDVVPTEDALPERSKVVLEKYPIYDDSNNITDYTYSLVVPSIVTNCDILSEISDNPINVIYNFDADNYYIGEKFNVYITNGTKNYTNSKNLVTADYAHKKFVNVDKIYNGPINFTIQKVSTEFNTSLGINIQCNNSINNVNNIDSILNVAGIEVKNSKLIFSINTAHSDSYTQNEDGSESTIFNENSANLATAGFVLKTVANSGKIQYTVDSTEYNDATFNENKLPIVNNKLNLAIDNIDDGSIPNNADGRLATASYVSNNFISKSQVDTGYNATIPVFLNSNGKLKVPAIHLLRQNIAANTANDTIIVNIGTNYGHSLAYRVTDETSEVNYSNTYNLVTSKYLYNKFYTKEQCDNNYLTADDLPTNILTDNNLDENFDANTNFRPIEKWSEQNPVLGVIFPNPAADYTKSNTEYRTDRHGGISTLYFTSKDKDYSPYFISSGDGYDYYKNLVTADYLHTKFVTKTDFSSALTEDNVSIYSGVQNNQILVKKDNNGTLFVDVIGFEEKNNASDYIFSNPYSHKMELFVTGTNNSIDYSTSKNLVTSKYLHTNFAKKSEIPTIPNNILTENNLGNENNILQNSKFVPLVKNNNVIGCYIPAHLNLEIGNTDAIKASNLAQLQSVSGTQFFCSVNFGIGVGSFNSGTGGECTINTATGKRVHYLIDSDGSVEKDIEAFDHSELFYDLGVIELNQLEENGDSGIIIDIEDAVEKALFKKAANIVLTINSEAGSFKVNCLKTTAGPLRNEFNSPTIASGQTNNWTYFKITTYYTRTGTDTVADLPDSKLRFLIETF